MTKKNEKSEKQLELRMKRKKKQTIKPKNTKEENFFLLKN